MDLYSKFFVQFIYGMQNELKELETFVFSTRLTRITNSLKRREFDEALKEISKSVPDWSGGTNIGYCFQTFNREFATTMLNKRAVVVIISDGWDRGDPQLLEDGMQKLKKRSYRIIWLNPLLGGPNYQPISKGMKAALPYIDHFLPIHNFKSLISFGKKLKSIL